MPQPSGVLRCDWAKMLAETLFFDTSAAGLAALKDWGVEVEADRQRISRTAACINLLQAYDGEAQSLDRLTDIASAKKELFLPSILALCFKRIFTLRILHGTSRATLGTDIFTITDHKEFAMIEYL